MKTIPRIGIQHLWLVPNNVFLFVFIPWILIGLQNPRGFGNSHVCLTFLFSKVLRALTPSGHNDPVCWDVDNCDKKTRDVFFTSLLHDIELVNIMSDD